MPANCGHRSAARAASFWRSSVLADSGGDDEYVLSAGENPESRPAAARARGPGHERRALRLSPARLLGRRQRGLAPQLGRRQPAGQRLPNAQMVHLPVHASWLNQIEVYFSVIRRKLLSPDDFDDLDHLAEQILAFQSRYNTRALRPAIHPHRPQPAPGPHPQARQILAVAEGRLTPTN
jgi:hypothetical protein